MNYGKAVGSRYTQNFLRGFCYTFIMPKNVIIIISGAPATGKTTLGKKLSAKYNIPFISKDALKERIFDNLGWSDKAWSLKVSAASHRIMDYFIAEELKA